VHDFLEKVADIRKIKTEVDAPTGTNFENIRETKNGCNNYDQS
jgi:hypothetical protein